MCQEFILHPEKVIWLPHSLKVKEKQVYIRKRFKLEKRTRKCGGKCREWVQCCGFPQLSLLCQSSNYYNNHQTIPNSPGWCVGGQTVLSECFIWAHSYKSDHLFWRTCQLHAHFLVKILIMEVPSQWQHHWHSYIMISFIDAICHIVLRRSEVLKWQGKKKKTINSVSLEKGGILHFMYTNSHQY